MPSDRDDIRDLMTRYCFALDDYALAELAALFTADGVWQARYATATGPAEIEATLRRVAPNPADGHVQRHLNTNILITVDGDRATARSYYTVVRPGADGPTVMVVGTYRDTLARTGDGWRFRERVLVQDLVRLQA
jgi:3-phenylpropionate/cinnamic acid dioxygenase small subunit